MISGIINSTPFSVYECGGEIVVYTPYYISWTPSDITGSFTIGGSTYSLEDYSGYFEFDGSVITESAFKGVSVLSTIETDVKEIESAAFYNCYSLSGVSIPYCEILGAQAFRNCSMLSSITLPVCSYIGSQAFYDCGLFYSITLESTSVCVLSNSNAMQGTGITSSTGCIFVPSSLLSSYKVAPEWSYFWPVIYSIGDVPFFYSKFDNGGPIKVNYIEGSILRSSYLSSGFASVVNPIPSTAGFSYLNVTFYYSINSFSYFETNIPSLTLSGYHYFGMSLRYGGLKSIKLTSCVKVPSYNLGGLYNLEYAEVPMVSMVDEGGFYGDSSLKYIDLPVCTSVDSKAFGECNSLSSISLPVCEYIGASAFSSCTSLLNINLPSCSMVMDCAFDGCNLVDASLPVCNYIGNYAFRSCNLSEVSLPVCSYIGRGAFRFCSNLSSFYLSDYTILSNGFEFAYCDIRSVSSNCTFLGEGTFAENPHLSYVDLPECLSLYYTFKGCSELTYVNIPKCVSVGSYTFSGCTLLSNISLPSCTSIYFGAFYNCTSLSYIYLPVCRTLSAQCFIGTGITEIELPSCTVIGALAFTDTSLNTIILRTSSCKIYSNTFNDTPIASGSGSIYVPSAFVDAYKSAQYWSAFSAMILPIPS